MRDARATLALSTTLLVLLAGCADGSDDETVETTVDIEVCGGGHGTDAESDEESCSSRCAVQTEEQKALIEEYVAAWNAQEVDALMALAGDDVVGDRYFDVVRCEHEAVLAAGVTLSVDFDVCQSTLTADSGETCAFTQHCLEEFNIGDPESEEERGKSLLHSGIPHEALAMGMLDDAATEAFRDCRGCPGCDEYYSGAQRAVIDDYVEAFNVQDADAIVALMAPEADPDGPWVGADEARCQHEAIFAADLTLGVDFESCSFEFTDASGQALLPSANGPCLIGWGGIFEFTDDGTGEQLLGTWIANDLLIRDGTDAVDEQIHDSMDVCAGGEYAD